MLDTAWILGEAEERGIEVSEREVAQEFERTKDENFQTEKEYEDFLEETGFTQEDIDLRVKLQLLSTKIQEEISGGAEPQPVSEEDAALLRGEQGAVRPAPPAATSASSRRRRGGRPGRLRPAERRQLARELEQGRRRDLDRHHRPRTPAAFVRGHRGHLPRSAQHRDLRRPHGRGRGPGRDSAGLLRLPGRRGDRGGRRPPSRRPSAQIDQQLGPQIQQEQFSAFLADYRDRWTEVTICADDFITERCDNFNGEIDALPRPDAPRGPAAAAARADGLPAAGPPEQPDLAGDVRALRSRLRPSAAAAPAR